MTDEYAAFRGSGDNLNKVLTSLVDELAEAEHMVELAQEQLEIAKAKYRDIAEVRIPEVVDGLEGTIDLGDGRELQIREEIRSSIAGDKREPAIRWLDEHGYGHIVKRQVTFEFPRGDEERCEAFIENIKDLGMTNLIMKTNFTVHHATLNSWVKEQLKEGIQLPKDTFGIFRQRTAKVKEK